MSVNTKQGLLHKLNLFIRKYYFNKLIQGFILCVSVLIIFFILFSFLEHYARFDVKFRTVLFWIYIAITFFISLKHILFPILKLIRIGKILSYRDAAKIIGIHFVEIFQQFPISLILIIVFMLVRNY